MKFFNQVQNQLMELRSSKNLQVSIQRFSYVSELCYLVLVLEIPTGDDILMDLGKTLPQ